jgi:hypothetical protein
MGCGAAAAELCLKGAGGRRPRDGSAPRPGGLPPASPASQPVGPWSVFCCCWAEKYVSVVKEIRSEFSAIFRKFQEFLRILLFGWEFGSQSGNVEFLLRINKLFDFVGISQPKKALFGVSDLISPLRFACKIVCTYK